MKISIDFLKQLKTKVFFFLLSSALLFLPNFLLKFIGLDSIKNTFLFVLVGIIWLVSLLAILCQIKITPTFLKFLSEWGLMLRGLLRPLVSLPIALAVVVLYTANLSVIDKTTSFILQIIATIAIAIAGAFFYDIFRTVLGDDLLIKKGQSAVRNLSLARLKTKNIYDRTKEKASAEEIQNLLLLLEKDIANATQEWNDILPGVAKIEEVYNILSEREKELEIVSKEKARLNTKLLETKELTGAEKEALTKEVKEKEQRIFELLNEVDKLRVSTDSVPFSGTGVAGLTLGSYIQSGDPSLSILGNNQLAICSLCGRTYSVPIGGLTLLGSSNRVCDKCRSSSSDKLY